jgi:Uma2 family endonuclease
MSAERVYVERMSMPPAVTAEELLHLSHPDQRVELVRGVLVVREPAGLRHGRVTTALSRRLADHVAAHALGEVYTGDTGFTLSRGPDTVRAADIGFLCRERVLRPEPVGFPDLAPDLVVEVRSPGDRPGEVLAKVADWLSAGTRLVWVIDPERRLARVYRVDGTEDVVTEGGALDGEAVVPGFDCPLEMIL